MIRHLGFLVVVASLFVSAVSGQASPVKGGMVKQAKIPGGQLASIREIFKGGERACVIVVGDHRPVVPLLLKVEDAQGNLVGEDKNGGDFCTVIWYPPRDGEYRISIGVPHIPGEDDFNIVYISVK
jgi:hypothetical protein